MCVQKNGFRRQKFGCPDPLDLLPVKKIAQKWHTKKLVSQFIPLAQNECVNQNIPKKFMCFKKIVCKGFCVECFVGVGWIEGTSSNHI